MKNSREPGRKKARIRDHRANVIHDENERAPMKLGRPRSRSSFKNRDDRSKAGGKGGRIDHRFCERARERAEGDLLTYLPPSGETTAIGSCGGDYATAAAKAL